MCVIFNNLKANNTVKTWELIKYLTKVNIQMTNRYMKKIFRY